LRKKTRLALGLDLASRGLIGFDDHTGHS
jgi:hypothetical protein